MKTRLLSLTILLLAGAASGALAQDRPPRTDPDAPAQPTAGAPQHGARGAPARHEPAAAGPVALPPAPRRDEHVADHGPPQAGGPRGLPGARVQEHDRRVEDRSPGREPGWDRRNDDRHDEGLRPPAARDAHRDERQDDRHVPRDRPDSDWARDHDHDRDRGRDHGRRDGPRWDQHRYPPIYDSPSRYRGPGWRPPHGYYARAWRFGDILPRGWYGPQYQLLDWWAYDLPEPPYGYDWVRVGRDALLIDGYTGRIVQVVRLVFW